MRASVISAADALPRLDTLLRLPITNYVPRSRVTDSAVLLRVLEEARAPCELGRLEAILSVHANTPQRLRATLAWMLKYDLLRVIPYSDSHLALMACS